MPERPRGKRRRGAQQQRRPDGRSRAPAAPVQDTSISNRLPGLPLLAIGAIVVVVLIVGFIVLRPGGDSTAGAGGSASPGSSAAAGNNCPTSQPPALPAGQTRTVTLNTPKGAIVIEVKADLSPIAAGNFVALASCGFYDGTVFHRVVPKFVIQGGDPSGTGSGGPGYNIKDEPVTTTYGRATVAMARSTGPDSVGSQFFIVLDDAARTALANPQANNYQIIGAVTSGMEAVDAIAAAAGGVELPSDPIPITTATVANP
jgi:cyclophilin family peptidyl-prolyl cis-trans isomerase